MNELEEIVIEYEKLNPRKARTAHMQLLRMRAQIASLEMDVYLADAAYLDHLAALRAQSAEIAALKAQIAELTKCKHLHITIRSKLYAMATREQPAEYLERAECKDCGTWMDVSDIPDNAEVT